ncbi:MAG: carboxypeptidase regulatory-like domain-containing protein, partial [Muribaculaceae bacterium]|nr:carboxypeptidase regulatory-like domain-containing protein [Muribaculaceae bacterium]
MNKRFLSLAVMAIVAWTTMMAVTVNDIRVYINPGHGCWMTRNLPLVNKALKDTTGFHESNTNLWKAFGIMEKLIEWGVPFDRTLNQSGAHHEIGAARSFKNPIVFSRVKNTPWYGDDTQELYNRDLTEVAAEANYNDFDYFISIHSNAYVDGTNTNYMALYYNGRVSASYNSTMAAGWYLLENPHQMWTNYPNSPHLLEGSGGYEVLASLNVPGYMSEGFFHTYQPARHKIMNPAVARIEGIGYAKGLNDYFSLGKKDSYGMIYGILRHATETFSHTYYTPNTGTLDKYKPINGATVKLKKDGQVVQTVVTDGFYNGAFVFDKVAPGNYTVECSHPDYATSSFSVTVEANKIVYPTASISSEGMSFVPVQGAYAYGHTLSKSGDNYVFSYKATANAPKASIILTNKSTGAKTTHDAGKV